MFTEGHTSWHQELFQEPKLPQSYYFFSIHKTVPTNGKLCKPLSEPKMYWHGVAIRRQSERMVSYETFLCCVLF